jgi:hypothetical protein
MARDRMVRHNQSSGTVTDKAGSEELHKRKRTLCYSGDMVGEPCKQIERWSGRNRIIGIGRSVVGLSFSFSHRKK